MFNKVRNESGYYNYTDSTVLESGQTVKIVFSEDFSGKKYYYGIYLVISHKRKNADVNNFMKIAGKDGIKGLLWAKGKVREFEEFISEKKRRCDSVIYCCWYDNRRRDAYERGLRNLGYKYSRLYDTKVLSKTLSSKKAS